MNNPTKNELAFPVSITNTSSENVLTFCGNVLAPGDSSVYGGMELRDYFAAKAMQGAAASNVSYTSEHQAATDSYRMADAMLKARKP
jgi:hypothetical protein